MIKRRIVMKKILISLLMLMFVVGCTSADKVDSSKSFDNIEPDVYVWNTKSGRYGTGRCHVITKDGRLGPFVKSELCGR